MQNRPELDSVDLTATEDEGSDADSVDMGRATRSSSRGSVCSFVSASDSSTRGRGRPETTGEYRIKKALLAEREAKERKRKIEEEKPFRIPIMPCHIIRWSR